MQDPSHGVPHQLLQHVHLLSSYQYPFSANTLPPEQMLELLVNAPRVIREVSPVAWTYLSPPKDGTIFLAWQPNCRTDPQFASDGYVWSGPEKTLRSERRGFTFEVFMAECGFDPRMEQIATHRRMRYRLIGSSNGQQVDPALELVHYCQAPAEHRIPARQIPITTAVRKSMSERQWLEAQGSLIRKEFMLNDRPNWPSINMPNGQMQPNYAQQNPTWNRAGQMHPGMNARGPGQPMPFQNQAPGRPPYGMPAQANRRPNQGPASRIPAVPPYAGMRGAGYFETISDDEENPSSGDLLDMMTPREISLARYRQHHEWMEHIFSSPYSTSQITPMALAFGLPGELSELTEGLLNDPTAANSQWNSENPVTTRDYQPLGKESVAELEKRVAGFLQRGEEQLNEMRKEHAKRMEEMSQGKQFSNWETKLARASWDDGSDQGQKTEETVQGITQSVESTTGLKIVPRDEVKLVQSGGLIPDEEPPNGVGPGSTNQQDNSEWNMQSKEGELDALTFGSFNAAADTTIAEPPATSTDANELSEGLNAPADTEMLSVHEDTLLESDGQAHSQDDREAPPLDTAANEDTEMQEMTNDADAVEEPKDAAAESNDPDVVDASDWIIVNEDGDDFAIEAPDHVDDGDTATALAAAVADEGAAAPATEAPTTTAPETSATAPTSGSTNEATPGHVDGPTSGSTPGALDAGALGATPATLSGTTPRMFDTAGDFGDFDDLDTAGEALEGYGGPEDEDLGLDLEPSAFGDAFENHDTPASGT